MHRIREVEMSRVGSRFAFIPAQSLIPLPHVARADLAGRRVVATAPVPLMAHVAITHCPA